MILDAALHVIRLDGKGGIVVCQRLVIALGLDERQAARKAKEAAEWALKTMKKHGDDTGLLALLGAEAAKTAEEGEWTFHPWPNYNNEAWMLVTHPERLAHPGLAVRMAALFLCASAQNQ